MKLFLFSLLSAVMMAGAQPDPVADKAAVVTAGNARFTVLTPQLIRMEWAADGVFEDRATLAVVNRRLDVPPYRVQRSGETLIIRTDSLTLRYNGPGIFDKNNLRVTFRLGGKEVTWRPGMKDKGNLMGTARTLDRCDGTPEHPAREFVKGIVSRGGWTLVDESDRHILVDDPEWGQWVALRDTTVARRDLYLFAYGHRYKQAVSDYIRIGGKIPLPPKYAFGYWWSRFWQYSDWEFLDLARTIRELGIPADVMILDMDWHERYTLRKGKDAIRDEAGQKVGWTGYTWQHELFPSPEDFLEDLHGIYGFKTALNLHPASGITPLEDCYDEFIRDYTSRTDDYDGPRGYIREDGSKAPSFFRADQREWAEAWFQSVLHPIERQGVDFWWIDWQQFKRSKYVPGLSNTFWLNHLFFNDKIRQGRSLGDAAPRPMIYHRWGGLGSHRYQVGFSGDIYDEWTALQYIPWFTATASNVGFGYWGHDIGGLRQWVPHHTDPEIYTRWFQSAVFTPIFKTHWNKSEWTEKRIWMHPDHFAYMKEAIRLRYNLSPYIYNAAREAYDTGISMCRPMYYEHPEAEEAYTMKEQYYFGNDILAVTICHPADTATGLSERPVWFPEGERWYSMASGRTHSGSLDTLHFTIGENPWFVRAGAVIPMADEHLTSLQQPSNVLRLFVAPGDGESRLDYYEDDGVSQAYATRYAITAVTKSSEARSLKLTVGERHGAYEGMSASRRLTLTVEGVLPPEHVKVNGRSVPYSRHPLKGVQSGNAPEAPVWTYDGASLAWTLWLPEDAASRCVTVEAAYSEEAAAARGIVEGKKGLIRRIMAFTPEVKKIYCQYDDPFQAQPQAFLRVSQCGSFITEHPDRALEYLRALDVPAMLEAIRSNPSLPEDFKQKLAALTD